MFSFLVSFVINGGKPIKLLFTILQSKTIKNLSNTDLSKSFRRISES